MSDHLIAEANRHAMALPTTHPTHADIAWYVREVVELRAEVERLTKQIKDDNRSYGCELRDPNGTIWEQAAKDHTRAERAEAELKASRYETVKAAQEGLRECIRAERAEAEVERLTHKIETARRLTATHAEKYPNTFAEHMKDWVKH